MTILVPMDEEQYQRFVRTAIDGYAEDNVAAGRWPADSALSRSRDEFERLLPQGLQTPDNKLYQIVAGPNGTVVGALWFGILGADPNRSGFVYNIRIEPAFRGRGHAKAALELLEQIAMQDGLTSIGLHVFGFNTGAQALYRSLGYGITGFNMRKPLRLDRG